MNAPFTIAGRPVGGPAPCLVVAELSANHRGSLETALATVRAAADAGADAVKFQTYTPDTITLDCDNEHFRIEKGTIWDGRTLHDLYREAYTPWEWHEPLARAAADAGLLWFSSPFDPTAVEFLDRLGCPAYKIASFEIHDLPLIAHAAGKGRPMILSTGLATLDELTEAAETCRAAGAGGLCLLKCTSAYPAPAAEANLRTIPDLARRFGCPAGLSDHTTGIALPIAAAALGAALVEKHFILDRALGGPDAPFSLEPAEFRAMVAALRDAEAALGEVSYEIPPRARRNREFCRSLFAVADIAEGERFTPENVRSIRPAAGLPPKRLPEVLGRRARRALPRGTPLTEADLETES